MSVYVVVLLLLVLLAYVISKVVDNPLTAGKLFFGK
jgi:hypothetical protein